MAMTPGNAAEARFYLRVASLWAIIGVLMFPSALLPSWWLRVAIAAFFVGIVALMVWYNRHKDAFSSATPRWSLANGSVLPGMIGGFAASYFGAEGRPWWVVGGAWLLGAIVAAGICLYAARMALRPADENEPADAE